MHCNITSIKKHKDELCARFKNFDILSINETNLKPQQNFSIPGYKIFRNDRIDRQGGGVMLTIRNNIKCCEILNVTVESNEVVAVQIETSMGHLLIASLYVPPNRKLHYELFEQLYNLNNDCLILGDLNASLRSMGSRKTNSKGLQLQQILYEGYLQCIDNDLTTYIRNSYEEKIDWILASQPTITFVTNVETHEPFGLKDDHKPLTFYLNMIAELKPEPRRTSLNFKSTNWQLYRSKLNDLLSKIDHKKTIATTEQIESYVSVLTECIDTAAKTATPPTNKSLKHFQISRITKDLIQRKHRAFRKWRKTNNDNDKKEYYDSRALLTNALRNERIEKINRIMSSLRSSKISTDKVWATVRKFHNKRMKQQNNSELTYNNQTANTDYEKANLFASYFENEIFVEKPDYSPFHAQVRKKVEEIKRRLKTVKLKNETTLITKREVKTILKQLPNSSPGADSIHNRCLKNYTPSLLRHLEKIFNAIIHIGYIPQIWKKANIILLLKPKKDPKLPSSYRPISLLSCLGKVLEKIIKQRMLKELNDRNILPPHQAGFRPHRSTMYNIMRLERYAREQLQKRQQSAVIFFDIKAAFDTVWFDGLIYKLFDQRLPEYLVSYIISFLDNRTASIEIENILSKSITLKSGTPQGSPLSPLLYIIYTSDSMNGIDQHTEHGLFADDTALWTSSNTITNLNNLLQSSTNEFQKWCNAWKLTIQPVKTELLYFSPHPRKKYRKKVEIKVGDTTIKPTTSARYLGVFFDQKLDWRTQVKHVEIKVASRISLLRFLSKLNPNANLNAMLILYKSLVRSVIAYGSVILLTAKEKVWQRLQIIQNKAIRAVLGLPIYTSTKYIQKICNIPEIKTFSTALLKQAINRATIYNDQISENNLRMIQRHLDQNDI